MGLTANEFFSHPQGRYFRDLDSGLVDEVLGFFNDSGRVRRMIESEVHHDRPALYGVIRELNKLPVIKGESLDDAPTHHRRRIAQFVGVVVKVVMEQHGWVPTGHKAALGKDSFISRGERYMPPTDHPEWALWAEAHPGWGPRSLKPSPKHRREQRKPETEVDDEGRTRAQQMRDIMRMTHQPNVEFHLIVTPETIHNWLRQAKRDDGEVIPRGRGTQPPMSKVEAARALFCKH